MLSDIKKQQVAYQVGDLIKTKKVNDKLTVFEVLPALLQLLRIATITAADISAPYLVREVFTRIIPYSIIDKLKQELFYESMPGFMILEGLTDDLTQTKEFLIGLTSLVSLPVAYPGEGEIVIKIKPSKTAAKNPSFANASEFFLHTDLSYCKLPPDVLTMICRRPATTGGGESLFGRLEDIITVLPDAIIRQLMVPEYRFAAPDHYRSEDDGKMGLMPVIVLSDAGPRVRFRMDKITAKTEKGREAVEMFNKAAQDTVIRYTMPKNSAVLVNQQFVMHGRTDFTPTFDAFDREFLRCYGTLNPLAFNSINHENGEVSF